MNPDKGEPCTLGFRSEPFVMTLVIRGGAATLGVQSASMGTYGDLGPQNGRGHAQILCSTDGVGIGWCGSGVIQRARPPGSSLDVGKLRRRSWFLTRVERNGAA